MTESAKEQVVLGNFTEKALDAILYHSSRIQQTEKRIDFISEQFLGVDYKGKTLIGDSTNQEMFVINFREVDCLTFLEYVAALSLSQTFTEFKKILKRLRYQSGDVSFRNRNHFFTDWGTYNALFFRDITKFVGKRKTVRLKKILNKKMDGSHLLEGIQAVEREIMYVPSDAMNIRVLHKLHAADYIGMYAHEPGLDVTHVGILTTKKKYTFSETCIIHRCFEKGG